MTFFLFLICYYKHGDNMKVKIFDEEHEKDLEDSINDFFYEVDCDIIDIKYCIAIDAQGEDQIYCYSAMIIYKEKSE